MQKDIVKHNSPERRTSWEMPFASTAMLGVSLDAAGLVALADLAAITHRTAIIGTASLLDALVIAPGMHKQQAASEVNMGEFPATVALTTGYVFRVENPATVYFLQRVGQTGNLVKVEVRRCPTGRHLFNRHCLLPGAASSSVFLMCPLVTITAIGLLGALRDWWGLGAVCALMLARLINAVVIRRRSMKGWKGKSEPMVRGDLLVLLSQDRWIRMTGLVDDLKTMTAGRWLRNTTPLESGSVALATLLVYTTAALAGNASSIGSIIILCLLLISAALLGLSNQLAVQSHMQGCIAKTVGDPQPYARRSELAEKLIEEYGKRDWAVAMGMVASDADRDSRGTDYNRPAASVTGASGTYKGPVVL